MVSSLDVETWQDARDALLDRAIKRWVMLLDGLPATFDLVTQLNEQPDMQHKIRLVRDVFAGKAPQTLLKRCNSLTKYTEFLKESCIAFPGSEQTLYRFLDELRMQGAKSSKLQSVIEAIRFITYVVGAEEVTRDLLSKRCIGVPRSVPKSQRGQASPFSVVELAELRAVLADCSQDEWDRVFCGSMLAAVYTRSRWSDLQHAVHILLDPDEMNPRYIEFHIKEHKTKAANLWTAGMLTAGGPAIGVVDDTWVIHWLTVRALLLGIDASVHPVMPAPSAQGEPLVRPLNAGEATKWVNLILDRAELLRVDRRMTTRSAKSTMLSFAAKYGLDINTREILGGHVGHIRSAICYSRDHLAGPLRALDGLLNDLRTGVFNPDCTRSGYFNESARQSNEVN